MSRAKILLLTLLVLVVYFLHQDVWNWKQAEPLVLGFLPVGLAYHAGYSVLAAILMAVLVKFAWPKHLETIDSTTSQPVNGAQDSTGQRTSKT